MKTGAIFASGAVLGLIAGLAIGMFFPREEGRPQKQTSHYGVKIILSSELVKAPYSEEERKHPVIQNIIKQCEDKQLDGCDTKTQKPEFSKSTFDRSVDEIVYTFVVLSGPEAGSRVVAEWRLIDPAGSVHQTLSLPLDVPQDFSFTNTLDFHFYWEPQDRQNWPLGTWTTEIIVNGNFAGSKKFEVVDGSGS